MAGRVERLPGSSERRAMAPLRRRTSGRWGVGAELGRSSEPRKVCRLGLWPTTRRFS